MLKRTLLQITFAATALASTMPEAQVYFWRDARNVANYSDVCPAGASCGVRPIQTRAVGYLGATATPIATAMTGASATSGARKSPINAGQPGTGVAGEPASGGAEGARAGGAA